MRPSHRQIKHKPAWEKVLTTDAELELKEAGRLLAQARKRRGMSTAALAARIGVDRRTLGQLEKGSPTVSLGILFQVLSTLGLLRGFNEILRPENDIDAISVAIRRARKRQAPSRKISDEKVNF